MDVDKILYANYRKYYNYQVMGKKQIALYAVNL